MSPPTSDFVPGFLHGHLSGDLDENTHVAVGVNGVIRTVVPIFNVENDAAQFHAIVPDEAFLAGFNSLSFLALSGAPEAPQLETIEFQGAQRFALSRGVNGDISSIVDSSGASWNIVEDRRIVGSVDEAFWNESDFAISSLKDLHVAGWAVDQEVARSAERVVFFVNGVLAGSASVNRARNDIEAGYDNSEVRFSGFHGSLSQFLPVSALDVRAFALSRGNAMELPITDEALAAIAAG